MFDELAVNDEARKLAGANNAFHVRAEMPLGEVGVLAAFPDHNRADIIALIFKFVDAIHEQARAVEEFDFFGNPGFCKFFANVVFDNLGFPASTSRNCAVSPI